MRFGKVSRRSELFEGRRPLDVIRYGRVQLLSDAVKAFFVRCHGQIMSSEPEHIERVVSSR